MVGIDETRPFIPVRIALLTVSDSRSLENDESGALLAGRLVEAGHILAERALVGDERAAIEAKLKVWIADRCVDAVIATGGTGVTGRDVTPEAFEALYEKAIPGFGELFRWISFRSIATSTIQSRATAGVANGTYLFAVPGSSNACREAWDEILRFQLDSRHRPCNFVELMPRLNEHRSAR